MHHSSLSVVFVLSLSCVVASCSSTDPVTPAVDGGPVTESGADTAVACTAYAPPAGFDATMPAVSFKMNVMGLFANSCSFSSCHGAPSSSKGGLFLGAPTAGGADAPMVHKNLVGVAAGSIPSMPFVTAKDPTKSYLMHKMDGDQCTLEAMCKKPEGCEGSMPQGSDVLPVASRDIVRRWIAQGALDN